MDKNLQHLLSLTQLEQMSLVKEEQENKLIICQKKMKICKETGAGIGQTLKLLEEELEIQRLLRDLERDIQNMKEQLNTSPNNITASISFESTGSLTLDRQSLNQLASNSDLDSGNRCKHSTSETYFSPDDVFNSDDGFDDEESDQFLLSQNLILNDTKQCTVSKQNEKAYKME